MAGSKADIIAQLKKEILPLQGFGTGLSNTDLDKKLGPIKNAFPNNTFPLGAIHEFIAAAEDVAVTTGFIATLLASLMKDGAAALWIGGSQTIFPPALRSFGIAPDKLIFIELKKEKEILWVMEEALKSEGLAAVVATMQELSFATSRRLQLAVEKSKVSGFVLLNDPRNINTTACISRWKITSLPSVSVNDMPGVGFPRWNVELLKARNGKTGFWKVALLKGRLQHDYAIPGIYPIQKAQTG